MPSRYGIIFVIGNLEVGGAETHLSQIVPALKKRSHDPLIYTLNGGGPLLAVITQHNVPVRNGGLWLQRLRWIPGRKLRTAISHLFKIVDLSWLLLTNRAAILHAFLPEAVALSGLAATLVFHPLFLVSRRSMNCYRQRHGWFLNTLDRFATRRGVLVLGNSRAVIENVASEGIPAGKLSLIYNGIRDSGGERNESPDRLVFLLVANLIPYKGHEDLLRALGKIRNQLPSGWLLRCAGSGSPERRDELEDLARSLSIASNIEWLGHYANAGALYYRSQIGLLVSHEEGFSNSILEGMAAGTPMVVTRVGGNAEAVIDGSCGIVVPPHDPDILAENLLRLAKDAALRLKYGRAARQRFLENFTLEMCVEKYETLYKALAQNTYSTQTRVHGGFS